MLRRINNNNASVLIFSLWIIMMLTVFAVQIGLQIRQRVTLLSRLETRSNLRHIVRAGIKKGISALKFDIERNNQIYTPEGKFYRHNNSAKFSRITLGAGFVDVKYNVLNNTTGKLETYFGFVDEERKLNINFAEHIEIQRLVEEVASINSDEARDIANAVISWREIGDTELLGFYSDDYYSQLEYPYIPKKASFEIIDEVRLLRGVTERIFLAIKPYITVYGDGRININTASREVLKALGLNDIVIDKIFTVRNGADGLENTTDDYMFYKTFDVASEIINFMELEISEVQQIDYLNATGKITTNSFYYMFEASAYLENKKAVMMGECVYNLRENRVEYWREK